jgi:hypothetical protein
MTIRTEEEITALLYEILTNYSSEQCSDRAVREQAAVVAQALSWALGSNLSPDELLKDNLEDETMQSILSSCSAIEEKDEF